MDWSLTHLLNSAVATRDAVEDPVTALAALAVPLYAAATILLWLLDRPYARARWKVACVSALASAGVALLANQAIGHLWDRTRPFAAHPGAVHLLAARSGDPSFPSDHAAAAFAIALAVFAVSARAGAVFLLAATAIAVSRVALGLHYPSDVLAGALVGWASAQLVVHVGRPWTLRAVALLSRLTDPVLVRLRVRRFAA
jgi:undecaprenyl-diphosphatase